MNCSQRRHLLERLPLSLMGAAALHDIRSHAAICPVCATVLESAAKLEKDLAGLPEIDVPRDLNPRIMASISAMQSDPIVQAETDRTLLVQILKNLSFVLAAAALVIGVKGTEWLGTFLSLDTTLNLHGMMPSTTTNATLLVLACLLFLAGFALMEGQQRPHNQRISKN